MAFTMERWYQAAAQRFAVRKYAKEPTQEELAAIGEQAKGLSTRGVRIVLGEHQKAFSSMFMGSGRIKGTARFAAFLATADADARTVGYLGEAFVLECTAMGLGTCWLGVYNKKAVERTLELQPGERLTCITPLGEAAEHYAARPRKELTKLTDLSNEQLTALPEWQRFALECARRAPSATNAQPWKFIVEDDKLIVRNTGNNFGYGMLDCGIAMLHMELGAAHGGVAGDWAFDGADAVFTPAVVEAYEDEEYYEEEYGAEAYVEEYAKEEPPVDAPEE